MTVARLSVSLGLVALALVLSGCNKPKTPEGTVAVSADSMAKPASLADVNPMAQKPGLWEMTTAMEGMPKGIVSQFCMDKTLSERMVEIGARGMGDTQCSQSNVVKAGNTVDIDSVCQMTGHKVTSHIRMVMVSDSEYTQTINSTMEPPMSGTGKSTTTVTGKRTGDCPADMKAGDMTMPGGIKINMYDALKQASASKAP